MFGSFGKPAAQPTFGGFGAAASTGGFGAFGAAPAASSGGMFGGFGAPASSAAGSSGVFGAAPASSAGFSAFGAPASTGGFSSFMTPAASSGGFSAFGAPAASSGGFSGFGSTASSASAPSFSLFGSSAASAPSASTGSFGGFGSFGAPSAGGFGGFGSQGGFGGFGQPSGFGAAPQPQPLAQAQPMAKFWLTEPAKSNITQRTQRKLEQHDTHIKECKSKSAEIQEIFARRESRYARPGASEGHTDIGDLEQKCGRMRHTLQMLKTALAHDRAQLQNLEQGIARHARMAQTLRRQPLLQQAAGPGLPAGGGGGWGMGTGWGEEDFQHYLEEELGHLAQSVEDLHAVMEDLELVLQGSISRSSSYPVELIEQVVMQSEKLWNAMAAKVAALHSQADRYRENYLALLRTVDPRARSPFVKSCMVKVVLQVAVSGLKFNQARFHDALASKLSISKERLKVVSVDQMDNAVVLRIEEGEQSGYSAAQVANTLRQLFTEGAIQLALDPISAFSVQIGHDEPIIHPAASPHIDETVGLDIQPETTSHPLLVAAPKPAPTAAAPAFGGIGAFGGMGTGGGGFGGSTSGFGGSTAGFGSSGGGFGASTGGFGASAGGGGASTSAFGAGFGAPTGGFGMSASSFGAPAGGFGASTSGFGGSTGGFGAGSSAFGAASGFGAFGAKPTAAGFGAFGAAQPLGGTAGSSWTAQKKPLAGKK